VAELAISYGEIVVRLLISALPGVERASVTGLREVE
jgi:hypothetical protein